MYLAHFHARQQLIFCVLYAVFGSNVLQSKKIHHQPMGVGIQKQTRNQMYRLKGNKNWQEQLCNCLV